MDAASIQAMIENGLPGAQVNVQGDDGVHFEAEVVAAQFAGKMPLARHRLVYGGRHPRARTQDSYAGGSRRAPLTVAAALPGHSLLKDSRWQKF